MRRVKNSLILTLLSFAVAGCDPHTDVRSIAAAIATEPAESLDWYADKAPSNTLDPIDGAIDRSGGGLGGHGSTTLRYDAKRYVLVGVDELSWIEWRPPNLQVAGCS